MKTEEKVYTNKIPDIILDKSLDESDNIVLFPAKVEKARKTIARIGLPNKKKESKKYETEQ